jgi:hypothetical protein
MSLEEVAAAVSTALARHGVRAVLSGGAVVSIYSGYAYESKDLDFIIEGIAKNEAPAMEELGFRKESGRYWTHRETEFWVEFPSGPLQVGDAQVESVNEIVTATGVLRLLPPTECVMDRLAAYYHWKDPQGLEQAVRVARRQEIDLRRIREWSRSEGETGEDGFRDFLDRLETGKE